MPELPEVETVRLTLKNFIIGKRITEVMVFYNDIIQKMSTEDFRNKLIGQTFRDIRRKGKYLFFDLDDYTMVSHLRMEGKYYLRVHYDDFSKHEHIVFVFDKSYLTYHDVRKFGTMELVPLHQEHLAQGVSELGLEANNPELDVNYLYPKISNSRRPIKSILLDQSVISGLGNIYVDETLYLSNIHPEALGKDLNKYQVERIIQSARAVLDEAVNMGGTTIRTYHSTLGVDGRFQNRLNVHTKVGDECLECGNTIKKIKVGGRGTYLCPTCQHMGMPTIIGLTGGIASGKSLISKWFMDFKVSVLDADKIYKNLLKSNKIMYNEIINHFGNAIMTNGIIDLRKLAHIIFNDNEKRELLNKLTHPFVLGEMKRKINSLTKKGKKLIVLDIPLLFEAHLEYLCDVIMVTYVSPDLQLQRLMNRDAISEESARARILSQMDLKKKRSLADIVIDNSDSLEETREQFLTILKNLRRDENVC